MHGLNALARFWEPKKGVVTQGAKDQQLWRGGAKPKHVPSSVNTSKVRGLGDREPPWYKYPYLNAAVPSTHLSPGYLKSILYTCRGNDDTKSTVFTSVWAIGWSGGVEEGGWRWRGGGGGKVVGWIFSSFQSIDTEWEEWKTDRQIQVDRERERERDRYMQRQRERERYIYTGRQRQRER